MKLSDYIKALEDGRDVSFKDESGEWLVVEGMRSMVKVFAQGRSIRIDPTPKAVSMAELVRSRIDCVFSHEIDGDFDIGGFAGQSNMRGELTKGWFIMQRNKHLYKYCKPRMCHLFSSLNFLDPDALAYRIENSGFVVARNYTGDVMTSFSIQGLRDGRCWPWEVQE